MSDDGYMTGYLVGIITGGCAVYLLCYFGVRRHVMIPARPAAPVFRAPVAPRPFVVTPEAIAFHDEMHARKGKKA